MVTPQGVKRLQPVDSFDEAFIRDVVFRNPETLPVEEIDDAYSPLIAVCTELNTPAGFLDVLLVTPSGKLVIVETKLWRNPESRRKVVAQIIDYAKELAKWDYADLQREINRRLKTSGNELYRIASTVNGHHQVPEAAFVDNVNRNLRHGRFLLLIVGDGIREGAASIAEFMSSAAHLEFTFGMVEFPVYQHDGVATFITPRVVAKTVEIERVVVEVPEGMVVRTADDTAGREAHDNNRGFYTEFWSELVAELSFSDPEQPLPNPAQYTNLYLSLPSDHVWISAYFMSSRKRIGVYVRCRNSQTGRNIARILDAQKEAVVSDLGGGVSWSMHEEGGGASVSMPCDDVFAPENRQTIKAFFAEHLDRFVNAFRPRVKRIIQSRE